MKSNVQTLISCAFTIYRLTKHYPFQRDILEKTRDKRTNQKTIADHFAKTMNPYISI